MFNFFRNLRHNKLLRNFVFWNFLGSMYRFLINYIPINFSIKQFITINHQFYLHSRFAFSDFKSWGNKHNNFFYLYSLLSKKAECFFDVGAHIGIVSLPISKSLKNNGLIYAFEASPKNLFYLNFHVKKNRIKNIKIVNKAVSSKHKSFLDFYESDEPTGMNSIISLKNKRINIKRKVESITLDGFCRENNLKPDIIKVDIEGAEIDLLKGSIKIIKKHKPIFFLSYHPYHIRRIGYGYNEIFKFLKSVNYVVLNAEFKKPQSLKNGEYLLVDKKFDIKELKNDISKNHKF